MKNSILIAAAAALALTAGATIAQPTDHSQWAADQGAGHHWARGERMGYNDWSGAQAVDYRRHHLRHPPRGYEWRESNGQYVMAAVATGVVASIIMDGHR
jgi:Ni/Co efflux regulator RcnB